MKKIILILFVLFPVFVIAQPCATFNSVTAVDVYCNGDSTGAINVIATATASPVSYLLSPGSVASTTGSYNSLSAGCYTVVATDANNCSANTVICVNEPILLQIANLALTNQNPCDIDTLEVLAFGGTPPYNYSINPFASFSSPLMLNQFLINAGTYTVTVTDANGCTATQTVINTNQGLSLASSQVIQPSCGQSDGSISAIVTASSSPVTYMLNPGSFTNTTGVFSNLAAVQYTLSASAGACTAVVGTFSLAGQLNPYPITANQNSFTGTVPTNGTAPYAYFLNSTIIPSPQSGLRCTGVDSFSITDINGCRFDTAFNFIAANSFPAITLNKNITPSSCSLTNDGQIIYAPSAPISYDWIANLSVFGSTSGNLNSLASDTYVVKLINAAGDCIQDTSLVTAIGTNCGNIVGVAYLDSLNNCVLDANDIPMPNATVTLNPGNIQRLTNANGEYSFLGLAYGNYTVSVDTNTVVSQFPICSNIVLDTISSTNVSDTINFPYDLTVNANIYCLTYATAKATAAPLYSFGKSQYIYFGSNNYAQTIPVTVYAVMDSIHHYHSSNPPAISVNGDTLMWSFPNMWPSNSLVIYYDSLQALSIGDTIPFKCWIESSLSLASNNPNDDSACVDLPIVTSYDPNDKQVSPQGIGTPGFIELTDNTLTYLVRFQNTGNAMAYNVGIEDTISTRLDMNSLEILDASHTYTVEKNNNAIRFNFNNIMLPDSNSDEPNSHGYILYQIKQENTNQLGDVIDNTAHIYFDYNPAVITNTTTNTIGLPVGVESISKTNDFIVHPNPTNDRVFIQATNQSKINNIQLFDLMGREINIKPIKKSNSLLEISTSELTIGIYLLNVNGQTIKLIKE